MPVTSRAKKQKVVIQCVTRTSAECLGATFVTASDEAALEKASAGSCADPEVAILASVRLRLAPAGWGSSYHSLESETDKSRNGNPPELNPTYLVSPE